jgi:translocation and assembly module TamA
MRRLSATIAIVLALGLASPVEGLDRVSFRAEGAPDSLAKSLRAASLVVAAQSEGRTGAQDIYAAARADYVRLLGQLYDAGYYSGSIRILIDGREAAGIAPLDAPERIGQVEIIVEPGLPFAFGRAEIGPRAPRTTPSAEFVTGRAAQSGRIRAATETAIAEWRAAGHPKAAVAGQDIVADHARRRLDVAVRIDPGPEARFGALSFSGDEGVRPARLAAIAGFPTGLRFSPARIERVADRLRRTGVFRAVTVSEAERVNPDGTIDAEVTLLEYPPRRLGFGAEVTSFEGLTLSGFWLHRNLLGGAERLRFDAEIAHIGSGHSGADYRLGASIDRPATLTPDTTLGLALVVGREENDAQVIEGALAGLRASHIFSERLTFTGGLDYTYAHVRDTDPASTRTDTYRALALPLGLVLDRRDNLLDPRRGYLIDAEITPFRGFGITASGLRVGLDARGYRRLGDRLVFAARVQGGAILGAGSDPLDQPRDYLFWSGGPGSVRGQPYRALGSTALVGADGAPRTGAMRFAGASVELRGAINERFGAVAFADYGTTGDVALGDATGGWHAGAGLGLRYETGIGPLRLDIAAPAGGTNANRGVQVYLGIGQAF